MWFVLYQKGWISDSGYKERSNIPILNIDDGTVAIACINDSFPGSFRLKLYAVKYTTTQGADARLICAIIENGCQLSDGCTAESRG